MERRQPSNAGSLSQARVLTQERVKVSDTSRTNSHLNEVMSASLLPSLPSAASPSPDLASSSFSAPAPVTEASKAFDHYKQRDTTKVVVRFKATGNAPILKQQFYKITASNRFQTIIAFLRKELSYKSADPLFLYINASFSPSPDDTVANLYKCFAAEKALNVNYSTTAAWG